MLYVPDHHNINIGGFSVSVNGPRRHVESISIGVGTLIGVEIGTCIVLDVGSDVTDAYVCSDRG